jgi:DNA modification methylase
VTWRILQGDCREVLRTLPAESVQTCVTSPPYWGLRDYGVEGQLGLERTPEAYVARIVEVFREVHRVLRPDGTLWLNLGDSYVTAPHGRGSSHDPKWPGGRDRAADRANRASFRRDGAEVMATAHRRVHGLKHKDLVGIPWRVAFALQADGWWLRAENIWHKPNPMPESVRDRTTRAHEQVFLLSKSADYFYDEFAVREPCVYGDRSGAGEEHAPPGGGPPHRGLRNRSGNKARKYRVEHGGVAEDLQRGHQGFGVPWEDDGEGRNRRSVWTISTKPFRDAHFATFPPELPEVCIQAGTSARGACPACGAPWARELERSFQPQRDVSAARGRRGASGQKPLDASNGWDGMPRGTTAVRSVTWRSTCGCPAAEPVPCLVLDPFSGAGTTGMVARRLGRSFVGVELKPEYAAMARRRIVSDAPLLNIATGTEGA